MKTVYEYIQFDLVVKDDNKKTDIYAVRNIRSGMILGYVAWHCGWRQYCYGPMIEEETIYSEGCLKDIAEFIKQLMDDRKK
jgi:hypothetical protein